MFQKILTELEEKAHEQGIVIQTLQDRFENHLMNYNLYMKHNKKKEQKTMM